MSDRETKASELLAELLLYLDPETFEIDRNDADAYTAVNKALAFVRTPRSREREYTRAFRSDTDAQRVELAVRDHDPEASTGMIGWDGQGEPMYVLRAWLKPNVAKRYGMCEAL